MSIQEELASVARPRESVLTIGVFDGVHLGHKHLISRTIHGATSMDTRSIVVTFKQHPSSVLEPNFKPKYLTTLEKRISLIKNLGTDLVVPITFDLKLSQIHAKEFLKLLQKYLGMKVLIAGPDFAMGRNREGTVEALSNFGKQLGFSVLNVSPILSVTGNTIRSTTVRKALSRGNVGEVAELLGRGFTLEGRVVHGEGRGKSMGYPTANLEYCSELAVPANGIYAAWAKTGKQRYMAAVSIGVRPTFSQSSYAVEAFLLNFEGDLYGSKLELEFVQYLREEQQFNSVKLLKKQIMADIKLTKHVLPTSE